jgi:hypothetical protein
LFIAREEGALYMPDTQPKTKSKQEKAAPAPVDKEPGYGQEIEALRTYARSVRTRMQKFDSGHCPHCLNPNFLSQLAARAGVDKAGTWRFYKMPDAVMQKSNLDKLAKELTRLGY